MSSFCLCDTYLRHCEDCDGLCITVPPVSDDILIYGTFSVELERRESFFCFLFLLQETILDKEESHLLSFITMKRCLQVQVLRFNPSET